MRNGSWDLPRLLAPFRTQSFYDGHWETDALRVAGRDTDYYASLFGMSDIDALLAFTAGGNARLVQWRDGRVISKALPLTGDGVPNMYMIYRSYHDEGYSLSVDRLDLRWKQVSALCKELESKLHYPVAANLYMTPPGAQAFPVHFDTHDVFVLQLAGSKRWRIYGTPVVLPLADTPSALSPGEAGEPRDPIDLVAGDLLYLPRGLAHEAQTLGEASLHLTIGVHVFRWADVLSEALTMATRKDSRFRQALPPGFLDRDAGDFREPFKALLSVFAEMADCESSIWRVGQRLLTNGQPQPDGHFTTLEQLPQLNLNSLVAQRAGMMCKVTSSGGSAAIHYPGNVVSGPAAIQPALQFIAATPKFAVRDLPDCLADTDKVVLAQRLVREGLLTIVRLGAAEAANGRVTPSRRSRQAANRA